MEGRRPQQPWSLPFSHQVAMTPRRVSEWLPSVCLAIYLSTQLFFLRITHITKHTVEPVSFGLRSVQPVASYSYSGAILKRWASNCSMGLSSQRTTPRPPGVHPKCMSALVCIFPSWCQNKSVIGHVLKVSGRKADMEGR